MIVSPTEPAKLRAIGQVALLPERYGADIAWIAHKEWVGVQRKEVKDFLASMHDGRIGQQVAQMQGLAHAYLVVEGKCVWTLDGVLTGNEFGRPITKAQWRGALWTIGSLGVQVGFTDSLDDTIEYVQQLEAWTKKDKHTSLMKREPVYAAWGAPDNRDFARHLLMGLPGVGFELAEKILERFGGVPWAWTVTVEQLTEIRGVGKKKAETMLKALAPLNSTG